MKHKKKYNATNKQNDSNIPTVHQGSKMQTDVIPEQKTIIRKFDWLTLSLVIFTASLAITSWFVYWDSAENSRLEMRAYLTVSDYGIRQFIVGKEIMFNVTILNVGKTPVINLRTRGALKIGGTGIFEADLKYKEFALEGSSTIGANVPTKVAVPAHTILTKNDSILIMSGKKPLAFLGEFVYEDVFGEIHHTEYCFKYFADYNFFGDCGINNKQD